MPPKGFLVPVGKIEQRILLIRGEKIIIDADLAQFYGVPTKRLNEQVKAIKQLLKPDPPPKKRRIGFKADKHKNLSPNLDLENHSMKIGADISLWGRR